MVTDKLQRLQKYQREMAKLEKELASFNSKLLVLPGKFGFKSMGAFIEALRAAGKGGAKLPAPKAPGVRKPRVEITNEMKQKVKALVNDGKTGAEIAKQVGISIPSVQNIKKELGLVKARE